MPQNANANQIQGVHAIRAPYVYSLTGGAVVQFVEAAADGTLLTGTTTEEVLEMLIDRVTTQEAVLPCEESKDVLLHLAQALIRQKARIARMAGTPAPGVVEKFGIYMHPCSSSNLAGFGYDVPRQILALEFKGGRVYHYTDVPQNVYDGLIEADSKGAYAARHIVGKFEPAPLPQQDAQTA